MSKGRFLVVDDSMLMRTHIRGIVNRHFDAEVIELQNGSELFSYLENSDINGIALILLDINLPDINGMEIAKKLQFSDKYRPVPIIIISGSISQDTVLLSLKVGVKDVIVKPINEDDFINRIMKFIDVSKAPKKICREEKKAIHDFFDVIRIEMKKADRGKYPLTILLMGFVRGNTLDSPFTGLDCRENLELGSRFCACLKDSLRETDSIIGLSSLDYLAILPFTGEDGINTVKNKLRQASSDAEIKHLSLIVSSVTYSQQDESADVLINSLERKYKSLLVVKTLNLLSEQ
ncbi:MAG: response regulator [Clostridiales bacterium]|nr:response regulator [Clostridiales bacterium]